MTAKCRTKKSKGCTCTFSFSPEYKGPKGGDYLKLVVTQSSHLSDGTGQDHTLGVHLLNTEKHINRQIIVLQKLGKHKQTHTQLHAC